MTTDYWGLAILADHLDTDRATLGAALRRRANAPAPDCVIGAPIGRTWTASRLETGWRPERRHALRRWWAADLATLAATPETVRCVGIPQLAARYGIRTDIVARHFAAPGAPEPAVLIETGRGSRAGWAPTTRLMRYMRGLPRHRPGTTLDAATLAKVVEAHLAGLSWRTIGAELHVPHETARRAYLAARSSSPRPAPT